MKIQQYEIPLDDVRKAVASKPKFTKRLHKMRNRSLRLSTGQIAWGLATHPKWVLSKVEA